MKERDDNTTQPETPTASSNSKSCSRRDFLKIAGLTGAAVGVSGGLGGLLAACGGTTTTTIAAPTTTTGAPTTTTGAPTTTTAPQSTTTVSAVETGREIKLGFVTPLTGPLASFGVPDQ